jgi:hypothetical protein
MGSMQGMFMCISADGTINTWVSSFNHQSLL